MLFPDKPKRKARKPDVLWDAVVEQFYPSGVPTGQRSYVNKLVRDLKELAATPDSLRRRVKVYPDVFANCVCTLQAVVKHWDRLKPQRPTPIRGCDPANDAVYQRRLKEWREF